MPAKYIVTNFAYGTGPYLRTTELALAVNDRLQSLGRERLGIIVPWVYGEKQRKIMLEEFGDAEAKHPREILLDAELGLLLKSIFYSESTYEGALRQWVASVESVSCKAHEHLSGEIQVEFLTGQKSTISGKDIVLELNRSPRVAYGITPGYYTTFGHMSEILRHVLEVPEDVIVLDHALVQQAIPVAEELEQNQKMHFVAEPGTFTYRRDRRPLYPREEAAPPIARPPRINTDDIAEGVYITVSGISGLGRLYGEVQKFNLKLYSNDPKAVPGSEKLLPHVVSNSRIRLQFARSGWGSVWLSQLSGTPLVAPDFDPKDDPEIYFNNICIEKLGLGVIYRGQALSEILVDAEKLRPRIQKINQSLLSRFGTYNGNEYCARLIVEDFMAGV